MGTIPRGSIRKTDLFDTITLVGVELVINANFLPKRIVADVEMRPIPPERNITWIEVGQLKDIDVACGTRVPDPIATVARPIAVCVASRIAFQPVVAGVADQRVVQAGSVDLIVTNTAAVPCRCLNLGPIPDRAIGEDDLFQAPITAAVEMVLDPRLLTGQQIAEVEIVAPATEFHLIRIEIGQLQDVDIGRGAAIPNRIGAIARRIAIGVASGIAFQPVVASVADQRVVQAGSVDLIVTNAAAVPCRCLNLGPIPDRAIGEDDLFQAPITAAIEMVLDPRLLTGRQIAEVEIVAPATEFDLLGIEVGELQDVNVSGRAEIPDRIGTVARPIAVGVASRIAFQPVVAGIADQRIVQSGSVDLIVTATTAIPSCGLDLRPIPDRFIGKDELLDAPGTTLIELVVDFDRLACGDIAHIEILAPSAQLCRRCVEIGKLQLIDVAGAAVVGDPIAPIPRSIDVSVSTSAPFHVVVTAIPNEYV